MGPGSSVIFTDFLVRLNRAAKTDQDHPPFIHYSNSLIPPRIEYLTKKTESPIPEIIRSFEAMRIMGADFGVMICNTAHIFLSEIREGTELPIYSLIEETARHIKENLPWVGKVGLLATDQTLEYEIYNKPIREQGLELIVPEKEYQELVTRAIFDEKWGIKATEMEVSQKAEEWLVGAARHLKENGASVIILGCTEISMVKELKRQPGTTMVDPMEIMARRCLLEAGISLD